MSKTKSGSDPQGWVYETILSRRRGRYYLHIAELNLIEDDENLTIAYSKLDNARSALFTKSAAIGAELRPPRDVVLQRRMAETILPFLIKSAAVAVVGAVLIVSAGISINYALGEPLRHAAQQAGRDAIDQVVRGLQDMAHRDLSGEREARLRSALRDVVPVLRPFIEELRPLFAQNETAGIPAPR